jgi:hypothetical protein
MWGCQFLSRLLRPGIELRVDLTECGGSCLVLLDAEVFEPVGNRKEKSKIEIRD